MNYSIESKYTKDRKSSTNNIKELLCNKSCYIYIYVYNNTYTYIFLKLNDIMYRSS